MVDMYVGCMVDLWLYGRDVCGLYGDLWLYGRDVCGLYVYVCDCMAEMYNVIVWYR